MPRAALEGFAQQTLDAVADDGAAQFLRDRQPQPRPLGARLSGALERVQHEEPGGRRAPLPVDTLEVGRTREAGALGGHRAGRLCREAFAPLLPPPLDDHLTRAGAHPLAKAVGLAALAGVRLIGPLHSFLARLPILRTCSIAVRRRPGQFGPADLRRTVHTAAA